MIPRRDLERHLRRYGCSIVREGGKHSVWEKDETGKRATLPRHRKIPLGTARAICKQLGVPDPTKN